MKKSFYVFVILALVMLSLTEGACTKLPDEPSEDEKNALREIMCGEKEGNELPTVYVLYDRHERAAYLLSVIDDNYVILKRSNLMICEEGEKNPYAKHLELKKYYGEPLLYIVYDPSVSDTPFYNLSWDSYGSSFSEAVKNIGRCTDPNETDGV